MQQIDSDMGGYDTISSNLQAKEDELRSKHDEEIGKIFINLKIDPLFVALRDELTSQVKLK